MRRRTTILSMVLLVGAGCTGGSDDGADGSDGGTGEGGSSTGAGEGDGGEMLGCPAGQTCDLVIASQTLDDRVEIFSPDDPAGVVYRGAIDLDFKPNMCDGCEPGDYGQDRLDEPYGLALAGQHLHVVAGHYPAQDQGTLLSFPFELFADREAGTTLGRDDYYMGGTFTGVVETPLLVLEPIWVLPLSGKLFVSVFNNDLFAAESTWTGPGSLFVLEASDPGAGFAVADLSSLDGGSCDGAAGGAEIADGTLAVACDGNESIAVLDLPDLGGTPSEVAAGISGRLCSIPGQTSDRRVRFVAPDGEGGFLVGEGPGFELLSEARFWWFGADCSMKGFVQLDGSDWQLGELVAMPGHANTWAFASGAASPAGHRGVYVVEGAGGTLSICGPIPGFEAALMDDNGEFIEPLALSFNPDATGLAVGAGPFMVPTAGPGYGRVLWATLSGTDAPCTMTATVTDLSAGPGAPVVDAANPATYRRAPAVVKTVRVAG
jgi:hypothetical protein